MNSDNRHKWTQMSKLQSYPTLDVVATAVAAYKYNNDSIVRVPITLNGVGYISNRQLIAEYMEGYGAPFVVRDEHREQAKDIVQYLEQTVVMQSLRAGSGAPDRFLGQLAEFLAKKEINAKEFGIIAWAPHLVDQYRRKDRVREVSARYELHSRYIGHTRDKITTNFTMIEKNYVKSIDCWMVYGVDDNGNMMSYWAKSLDKVCEVGKISARIKDHRVDEYRNGAKVTMLNYVKVL